MSLILYYLHNKSQRITEKNMLSFMYTFIKRTQYLLVRLPTRHHRVTPKLNVKELLRKLYETR